MLYIVYDPHGELFEVPAFRLNDLIVNRQWTFWHPNNKKEVFKASQVTDTKGANND